MKRFLYIIFLLSLAAIPLRGQDLPAAPSAARDTLWRPLCDCGCHNHPVNSYSGLNSLRARLANPAWDGKAFTLPDIGTGMRIEDGRILPLRKHPSPSSDTTPETSSGNLAVVNEVTRDPYILEVERGEAPVGMPTFVFFRLAGTHITDSPQVLSVNSAADLAVARNLRVRITGAADSATGSPEKNAAIALARAEHVASLMKRRGVPEERIEVLSEGGTMHYEPVSANRNCRIELFMQ